MQRGRQRDHGSNKERSVAKQTRRIQQQKSSIRKPKTRAKARPVVLLAGGNPQIAKADGDAPVQAYIAAMPGWKRDVGKRLDALIARTVRNVRKAVKWNSPMYGIEGQGVFLAFHTFTHYVKVTFFRGTSLRPVPPGASKHKDVRYLDVHEDDLDEAQMATWVKQAAALPGWIPGQQEGPVRKPGKSQGKAGGPIDRRIRDLGGWRGETLARMRALILEADPEMTEECKWVKPTNPSGVPVWSHAGIVCTGEAYKNVVKLTFAKGARIPDPSRLFNSSLEGNTRRAIDIHEGEKVDAVAFKALVKAAVAENGPPAKKR
jgi:hypothetical protein